MDTNKEICKAVEDIYDKGFNRMKVAVINTFEGALQAKPEISAKELYEMMKKHGII